MGEAIQGRSGEPLAAEDLGPVLERQVGRHDQAVPFVGRGDHVEQEFRPGLAGRHVAQFVEDQQIQLGSAGVRTASVPCLLASSSSVISSVTRKKRTLCPCWQAAIPKAVARCDFPVPLGPTSRIFSRWSRYSPLTSSSTSGLLTRAGP